MGLNESYDAALETESKARGLGAIAMIIFAALCIISGFFVTEGFFDLTIQTTQRILFIAGGILLLIGIMTKLSTPEKLTYDY